MRRPLDAKTFDKLIATATTPKSAVAAQALWGTKAISLFLGLPPQRVRRIMKRDSTFPARRRGGILYAERIELLDWLAKSPDE